MKKYLASLAIIYIIVLTASFFAPYNPNHEWRNSRYLPPLQNMHIQLFKKGDSYKFLFFIPTDIHLFGSSNSQPIFLLGTDKRGRDIFSRLLLGSQVSMSVGILGILVAFSIGTTVGALAGIFGGLVDSTIMRFSEILLMVPGFYLMLTIRSILPTKTNPALMYIYITLILSFIGWAGLARIIRGMTLSIKTRGYVTSATAFNLSRLTIITRHIIPQLSTYLITAATLAIPGYILGESALSFIGLGIEEPAVSWGLMLKDAISIPQLSNYPWIIAPGIMIFISILYFNILGEKLRLYFQHT